MIKSARKYDGGGATNPKGFASGENGINMPRLIINIDVKIRKLLGLDSIKGILPVRIICITRV